MAGTGLDLEGCARLCREGTLPCSVLSLEDGDERRCLLFYEATRMQQDCMPGNPGWITAVPTDDDLVPQQQQQLLRKTS